MKCEGFWFVFHLGLFAHLWGLCLHNETVTIVSCVFGFVSAGARRDLPSQGETTPDWILKVTLQILGGIMDELFLLYFHLNIELMRTPSSPGRCLQLSLCIHTSQTWAFCWPDRGCLVRPGVSGQTTWSLSIKWVPEACILVWPLGVLLPHLWKKRLDSRKWKLMQTPSAMIVLGSLDLDTSKMHLLCISLLHQEPLLICWAGIQWPWRSRQPGTNFYWLQGNDNNENIMEYQYNGIH